MEGLAVQGLARRVDDFFRNRGETDGDRVELVRDDLGKVMNQSGFGFHHARPECAGDLIVSGSRVSMIFEGAIEGDGGASSAVQGAEKGSFLQEGVVHLIDGRLGFVDHVLDGLAEGGGFVLSRR